MNGKAGRYLLDTNAVIAATAVTNTAVLVTADQKLHTVSALTILNFVP